MFRGKPGADCPERMMSGPNKRFFVVGMGPGARKYRVPAAEQAIAEADVVIGAERYLSEYRGAFRSKTFIDFSEILSRLTETIRRYRERGVVAVLVSGDPGVYSLLDRIAGEFARDEYTVIQGISSVQLAGARLGISRHGTVLLSAHGRPIDTLIPAIEDDKPAIVLTDKKRTPARIAEAAVKAGRADRRVWILENLSYPDERVTETTLRDLPGRWFSDLCVVVMEAAGEATTEEASAHRSR